MITPSIPKDVIYILEKLNSKGYEAYIVGGCVRDCILGRTPQDWDITTSAVPEQVKECFSHTYDTGIKHGTVTVVLNKNNYEITTYRIEGKYEDCRHPEEVFFTRNLTDDLLRRDFTMNAIAYHPDEGYKDPFLGVCDIEKGIIKGVGDPKLRFQEDALRMLRAIRFSSQLGFDIEPETYKALVANSHLIKKISGERIREELQKLIMAQNVERMPVLWETGLLEHIHHKLCKSLCNKGNQVITELKQVDKEPILCWTLFLQFLGEEEAEKTMRMLKFDTKTLRTVSLLIRKIKNKEDSNEILKIFNHIIKRRDCLSIRELDIKGNELMELGVEKGKLIGVIQKELLDEVLKHPEKNKNSYLRDFVKMNYLEHK